MEGTEMGFSDLLDLGPYVALALGSVVFGLGWVGVVVVGIWVVAALVGWFLGRLRRGLEGECVVRGREPQKGDVLVVNGEVLGVVESVSRVELGDDASWSEYDRWEELRRMQRAGWN